MNANNFIWLIILILLASCGSKNNDSNKSEAQVSTDSLTKDHSDSTNPAIEEPHSFESNFSVHDLFKTQNSDVVNAIAQEDFESAIKKIKHYWYDNESLLSETQKANFKYMHIYAMAGLVSQKKKSHSDLEKVLETYKDEFIITQHLEITQGNKMPFNQIQVEQEKQDTIKITCANNDGFNIHCFVNVGLVEKFDLTKHVRKRAYLCGRLVEYKLSNKDVYSWISNLELSDGFIKILEDEFEKE